MIDPTTLAVAGGAFVTFWGAKKLLVRINRPKDKQLPRTENTTNQILRLEQWHMLWSHPDNNTEFYVWDDESGWVEQSTDRVVKDLIGWDDHSQNVRIRIGRKIGVKIADGEWGPEHIKKVLDYGISLVKELLSDYEETEKQHVILRQRHAYERSKFEYTPQRYALDSSPSSPLDSRVRRIKKLAALIEQCDDGEMKRRLITRLEELEN